MTGIAFDQASGPEGIRIYAIGDVHGRLDLLKALLGRIDAQIAEEPPTDWRIILLGDYIDRGPDSRGVIDLLARRQKQDSRLITLGGNHDAGMLAFLADPLGRDAYLFTHHGGEQTLASYGISASIARPEGAIAAQRRFLAVVPQAHVEFLEALPRSIAYGDFFFCHAGVRPGIALDAQNPDDLIWIRDDFLDHAGLHAKVIVHGHTPSRELELRANRVNVDTHAYASGRLTALVIDGVRKQIMSIEGSRR